MKIQICALLIGLLAACGGQNTTAQNTTETSPNKVSAATMPLNGQSYDVTLNFDGEQPQKDTLNFANGKFESATCTPLGFPQTDYNAHMANDATEFHVLAKHPDGTSMDWKGTVRGNTIDGTATRTMNGKTTLGKFTGTQKK